MITEHCSVTDVDVNNTSTICVDQHTDMADIPRPRSLPSSCTSRDAVERSARRCIVQMKLFLCLNVKVVRHVDEHMQRNPTLR